MTHYFPVTYSLLSAAALSREVLPGYDIEQPAGVRLLYVGVNDTYLVESAAKRYILRVYRAGWRSAEEIAYELDLIQHLAAHGVKVAAPLMRHDGHMIMPLAAPEGTRYTVLYTYAAGERPQPSAEAGYIYGQALARLHGAASDFRSSHQRIAIDLDYLIDQPLVDVRPVLHERAGLWAALLDVAARVREQLAELPLASLARGVCHGDFQLKNAHLDAAGTLTIFDFDHSGPGWLAYDLAVFRPPRLDGEQDQALWDGFLRGYQSVRALTDNEQAAIPIFAAIIRIATLGFYARHRDNTLWASDAVNDAFFDQQIKLMQSLAAG
jgi:Ser/Thr protein kinase RdoA (MazF antagonist)